jgi:hypothetical protein
MKVSYQSLRAAMALVDPELSWWEGTIKGSNDWQYVVAQCKPETQLKVIACLQGYGLQYSDNPGQQDTLFAVHADNIEMDLPPKVIPEYGEDDAHGSFKRSVLEQMHALGIARIDFSYSGGGDSGNPDDITAWRSHERMWDTEKMRKAGISAQVEVPQAFADELSGYVWDSLVQWDVVNNDGGGGHLYIITSGPEPVFEFECYTNENITHTMASEEI